MRATVIVSVYKDAEALSCILAALRRQTTQDFHVIVTEDGEDSAIKRVCANEHNLHVTHLTQEDRGFRKTRAVNRAIASAAGSYLLFLDGDCIPHKTWLAQHLSLARPGVVLTGRRMHLGPRFSSLLRENPGQVERIEGCSRSLRDLFLLHRDGARNLELINPSPLLHFLYQKKHLNLVGCNFSAFPSDLYKVNGYDEDLLGIGGEDDDLQWRLAAVGVVFQNIKFRAVVYHLFHESRRTGVEVNLEISLRNISAGNFYASRGIYQNKL